MPKDIENIGKNIPATSHGSARAIPKPVKIAQELLGGLVPKRAEKLRKALPAYAMTLARQGKEVTAEILREALAKGDDAVMGPRTVFNRVATPETIEQRYTRIVKNMPTPKDIRLIDDPDISSDWRMMRAIARGDLAMVQDMITIGANIRFENDYPLRKAAEHGHLDVARFLVEQGAGDAESNDYSMRMAAQNGHLDIIKLLAEKGTDIRSHNDRALSDASRCGHIEVVKFLVENGADVRECNDSALREAAQCGRLDVIKFLAEKGADIRAGNNHALHYASANGHLDVVKFLVEKGADVSVGGNQALCEASRNNHIEVVKFLVEKGASARANNDYALRWTAQYGHLEIVKFLVEKGADVRADDDYPLREAAQHGYLELTEFLIKSGADASSISDFSMDMTTSSGHFHTLHLLAKHGADMGKLTPDNQNIIKPIFKNIDNWIAYSGSYPPAGLEDKTCGSFDVKSVKIIAKLIKAESYGEYTSNGYAYEAIMLFGTAEKTMDYLEKWPKPGKQPLHDAVQMISVPDNAPDLKSWADAVMQHGPEMARLVKFAANIPQPLKSADGKTYSLTKTREEAAKFAYVKGHENPELAALFNKHQMDEDDFNDALKLVKMHKAKTKNKIPDVTIVGQSFGMPKATFKKLPDGDYRGLVLGQITNCCQSIGSAGADCAKHGFSSESGGFYVVAVNDNKKGEEIIGQSWAWRGTKGELVLDSLETLGGRVTSKQWADLTKEFAKALKKTDITALHIGQGGATPRDLPFETAQKPATPKDYNGYRDSNRQYQVYSR